MLSKQQFINRIKYVQDYIQAINDFDKAIKKFAPSDFTGFYDEKRILGLIDFIKEDMDDTEDWIGWWFFETDCGDKKDLCKIWETGNTENEPDYIVETPSQLYDYLVIAYLKPISKENLDMVLNAQDAGIKFALKEIQNLQDKNATTKNDGWEEREAVMSFVKSSITNSYLLNRGIDANLNYQEDFNIISTL